jgi:LDH2 family malate/lactate/ureidoglycolate dehydrogenase
VRIPGQRAFAARRERLRDGIPLHPDIPPLIADLAEHHGIALPVPLPEIERDAGV